jgi:hypothetical protein
MTGAGPAMRFGGGGVREIGGTALGGTGGLGLELTGLLEAPGAQGRARLSTTVNMATAAARTAANRARPRRRSATACGEARGEEG